MRLSSFTKRLPIILLFSLLAKSVLADDVVNIDSPTYGTRLFYFDFITLNVGENGSINTTGTSRSIFFEGGGGSKINIYGKVVSENASAIYIDPSLIRHETRLFGGSVENNSSAESALYFTNGVFYSANSGGGDGISSLYLDSESSITNKNTSSSATSYAVEVVNTPILIDNEGKISGPNGIKLSIASPDPFLSTDDGTIINKGVIESTLVGGHAIKLENQAVAAITNSGQITGNINLGSNSNSSLTLNSGSVNGDVTFGNTSQQMNLAGGAFLGKIDSVSGNQGVVNIKDNFTLDSNSSIGASNGVNTVNVDSGKSFTNNGTIKTTNLNIASGSTLNVGNTISAANTQVYGTLNFGNVARSFNGNVTGNGNSTIDLGNASHHINGDLTLNSGDSLELDFLNPSKFGNLTVSGAANISAMANLKLNLESNYSYIADGSKFVIVDGGTGSNINNINSSKIAVNDFDGKSATLNFSTTTVDNNLILNVDRKAASELGVSQPARGVYDAITQVGSGASGKLKDFQQYLDTTSAANVEDALKSLTPQDTNSVRMSSIATVNGSVLTVEDRLNFTRNNANEMGNSSVAANSFANSRALPFAGSTNTANFNNFIASNFSQLSGYDTVYDESKDNGIWTQVFGSNIKQSDLQGDGKYKANSLGFAAGYDRKTNKNTRLGLSLSYANTRSTSDDEHKATDIKTYQINAYSGHYFDKFFIDTILSFAWNEYDSTRSISAVNSTAKSKYDGQVYAGKIKGGFVQNLGGGFSVIPELSTSFNHSEVGSYQESGAESLNLRVARRSSNFLEGRAGVGLRYLTTTSKGWIVSPKLRTSYGYNFLNNQQETKSNFVGQNVSFVSYSSKIDPRSLKISAGIDFYSAKSLSLSVEYTNERRQGYVANSGMVRGRVDF